MSWWKSAQFGICTVSVHLGLYWWSAALKRVVPWQRCPRGRREKVCTGAIDCSGKVGRVRYVLFYESTPEARALARENFPAHKKLLDAFHADATLLMAGPFPNPAEGSMAVFRT